jgi:hypothetical protein
MTLLPSLMIAREAQRNWPQSDIRFVNERSQSLKIRDSQGRSRRGRTATIRFFCVCAQNLFAAETGQIESKCQSC